MTDEQIAYARRITCARQAWKDLPGPGSAWGLKMRKRIAAYFGVRESEMT